MKCTTTSISTLMSLLMARRLGHPCRKVISWFTWVTMRHISLLVTLDQTNHPCLIRTLRPGNRALRPITKRRAQALDMVSQPRQQPSQMMAMTTRHAASFSSLMVCHNALARALHVTRSALITVQRLQTPHLMTKTSQSSRFPSTIQRTVTKQTT